MTLEKTERVNLLADIYAALLSERQRDLLRLYFAEDYSLAEIAEQKGISRQAVHDGLQRAVASMEAMDEKLGCLAKQQREAHLLKMAEAWRDEKSWNPDDARRLQGFIDELQDLVNGRKME